jgi:hypothetical protein
MFEFLRSIGLAPIEWDQATSFTGKGSPYIGEILDAAFDRAHAVVVLITPDEVAYLRAEYASGEEDPESRPAAQARPNVLFEAGMALGRDPDRTVLVTVGEVRRFSDIDGLHVVRLSNEIATRQRLAGRLGTAGCAVDLSGTDWHTAGDFSAPSPPGQNLGRRVPSQPNTRLAIDFDLKFLRQGGNKIDKLQVINRGAETAYDISLSFPEDAALAVFGEEGPIPKIPGGGKSVSVMVDNALAYLGSNGKVSSFDVTVKARSESGDTFVQEVFVDVST